MKNNKIQEPYITILVIISVIIAVFVFNLFLKKEPEVIKNEMIGNNNVCYKETKYYGMTNWNVILVNCINGLPLNPIKSN